MPAHYAHYRFGAKSIPNLPPEVRRTIQRFRQLYDVGLHGPDIFFYHNILFRDNTVALGRMFHQQTGEEFFARVCKHLRLEPNEAAQAYLYGVLAHYCLDSVCHPFVNEQSADGKIGHVEMETEFDRHLLFSDGKRQPNTFDCSPHIKLTRGECATVAQFYSPATPAAVGQSVRGMASCVKLLATPNGPGRRTLERLASLAGSKLTAHIMDRTPNKNCVHLNAPLEALYDQAMEKYPAMVEQVLAHMSHNAPLGEDFVNTFG